MYVEHQYLDDNYQDIYFNTLIPHRLEHIFALLGSSNIPFPLL